MKDLFSSDLIQASINLGLKIKWSEARKILILPHKILENVILDPLKVQYSTLESEEKFLLKKVYIIPSTYVISTKLIHNGINDTRPS